LLRNGFEMARLCINPKLVLALLFCTHSEVSDAFGLGAPRGAGGVHHLARLLGRGRAMEVVPGAADFDADTAERYGWINRSIPDDALDDFVADLAHRIASFPARRFQRFVKSAEVQTRAAALFAHGLQTRGPLELNLGSAALEYL